MQALQFKKLSDQLPPFGQGGRVLIFTEGVEFAGQQFFDVEADCLYDPHDLMPEECRAATHWAPRPIPVNNLHEVIPRVMPALVAPQSIKGDVIKRLFLNDDEVIIDSDKGWINGGQSRGWYISNKGGFHFGSRGLWYLGKDGEITFGTYDDRSFFPAEQAAYDFHYLWKRKISMPCGGCQKPAEPNDSLCKPCADTLDKLSCVFKGRGH